MKLKRHALAVIALAIGCNSSSLFATSTDEIFLTQEEMNSLPIEEHVDYLYSLLDYLAAFEKVQDKALKAQGKDKSAYLYKIQQFVDLLPTANAAKGDVCLCGTYSGSENGNTCNVIQKSAATGPAAACGAQKFTCNEQLYSIPDGKGKLEPICVKKSDGCAEMSNACSKALKIKLDALTDDQRAVDWANRASRGITAMKTQVITTNKTVVNYCQKKTGDTDCSNFAAVAKRAQSYGAKIRTAEERNAEAQALYDANSEGPLPSNSKGLPDPKPQGEFPPPPTTGVQGGDCIAQKRTQLGALACVACGLESADPEMSGGASEFIGLLGVVSQTYSSGGLFSRNKGSAEAIQADVIERLMTYGYCSDSEFGTNALGDGQVRSIIDGETPTKKKGFLFFKTQDKEVTNSVFAKFGIQGSKTKKWVASANSRGLFARSPHMSDTPAGGGGGYQTHVGQVNFSALARGHYKAYPNTQFSRCANALDQRNRRRKEMRMCQPILKKGLQLNKDNVSAYGSMREAIYASCNLKPKAKKFTQGCERGCSGQKNIFGFIPVAGCESGKGSEKPGGRNTPSKGNENPGNRGNDTTGKSGESSGNRSGGSDSGPSEDGGSRGGDSGSGGKSGEGGGMR